MKKLPQYLLLSTLILGLTSPSFVLGDETTPSDDQTVASSILEKGSVDPSTVATTESTLSLTTQTGTTTTTTTENTGSTNNSGTSGSSSGDESGTVSSGTEANVGSGSGGTDGQGGNGDGNKVSSENNSPTAITTLADVTPPLSGDGTEGSHFSVYSYDQLKIVATQVSNSTYYGGTSPTNTGKVYIDIKSDITFPGSRIEFKSNTKEIIINGLDEVSNKISNLYFTGETKADGNGMFLVSTDSMNITFKNLNFGSESFSNNNYYGFCRVNATGVTQTVQNIKYYATAGAQPFWMTETNSTNTLNFEGKNEFVDLGLNNDATTEEFADMQGIINFKEGSSTFIVHKGVSHTAFIWNHGKVDINIETGAKVNIQSGKKYFFYSYGQVNFNIADSGQLVYTFDPDYSYTDINGNKVKITGNTGATKPYFIAQTYTVPVNMLANSSFIMNTSDDPYLSSGTLSFTATDVSNIEFNNLNESNKDKPAIDSSLISKLINNSRSRNYMYKVNVTTTGKEPVKNPVLIAPGALVDTSNLGNYKSILFEPAVTIGGVSASPEVNSNVSKINSNLTGVYSALASSDYTYNAQYFITKGTTILDDATVTKNYNDAVPIKTPDDDPIKNPVPISSNHSGGSVYKVASASTITSNLEPISLDQLLAGDYIVYGRLAIIPTKSNTTGTTSYTTWQNTTVKVSSHQSVVIPTKIDFNDPDYGLKYGTTNGKFGVIFNTAKTFPITNQSNQRVKVTPIEMTPGDESSIKVVSENPGVKQLQLGFYVNNDLNWNLGNLSKNGSTDMVLEPYWSDSKTQNFYLDGIYGSPGTIGYLDYTLQLGFDFTSSN